MKKILFFLLVPVITHCQTVHIDKDRIIYEGKLKIKGVSKNELYIRAMDALRQSQKGLSGTIVDTDSTRGEITGRGEIKLVSDYNIRNTLVYTIRLSVGDGTCSYLIDSVSLVKKQRKGKTTIIPSEELIKGMDNTGPVASLTEKQLNEIDMDIQYLLVYLGNHMRKMSETRP